MEDLIEGPPGVMKQGQKYAPHGNPMDMSSNHGTEFTGQEVWNGR